MLKIKFWASENISDKGGEKMAEKKENKSLFLYTALIFVAAIVIVVISFFSQVNMEKKHNEYLVAITRRVRNELFSVFNNTCAFNSSRTFDKIMHNVKMGTA